MPSHIIIKCNLLLSHILTIRKKQTTKQRQKKKKIIIIIIIVYTLYTSLATRPIYKYVCHFLFFTFFFIYILLFDSMFS